ncbi:MAG: DUF2603 domain-containing protein [Sulfurospirillum sp.]|nr:DUF2603 domain-containing protein [Sulfurospirillum sp.]MBL0703266.1 DUF2603 domain-containing protein [Sulfurospirillum sp.]
MFKELTIFEIMNEISNKSDKTVMEIESTNNPDVKNLTLKSGNWSENEPWFVVDEKKKLHTMMSMKSLNKIIKNFKATQEDNFNLKLEKIIWQNTPIDFQDVLLVATDEIKSMVAQGERKVKITNADLDRLIKKIKKNHPNLFFNIQDLHFMSKERR